MKNKYFLLIAAAAVILLLAACSSKEDDPVARLSPHLGETQALVVIVCEGGDSGLAAISRLVNETPWKIFCRGTIPNAMSGIRDWAHEKGILGKRVFIVNDDSDSLWLAGDLADAVWIAPDVDGRRYEDEVLRVLHPGGVGIFSGREVVKAARTDVDEWRHPYHDPDNNVVSRDRVARLPGELRFQTFPVFAAMPNQTLFAGGRIFFFTGHIAFHEREEKMINTLTALNAYNGLQLWSRPLNPKFVVHNISKFATETELVFAEGATLWMLDTSNGKEIGKFDVPSDAAAAGDTEWKWVAQEGNKLWAAFGPPDGRVTPHQEKRQMGHWPWPVANEHYQTIVNNFGSARQLAAFEYPEMKLLWSVAESQPFDARALCIDDGRIFELAPENYAAARDSGTGKQLWRHTSDTSKDLFDAIGTSLKRQGWGLGWATYCSARASNGVVCIAGPSFKKTIGIGMAEGNLLWKSDLPSPHPFFLDNKLFVMPRVAVSSEFRAVDPVTGETTDEFSLGRIGSCSRVTVTPTQFFFRPGGGEGRTVYVDMAERKLADYEGIVRPGCFDGVVPANGRLYWMPLACDCWQVHGTFSMAPRSKLKGSVGISDAVPWAAPASITPAAKDDWPMYRADAAGTAATATAVPKAVTELWRQRLAGGDLTAPSCVDGTVFVGGGDGMVQALDAADGSLLWRVSTDAAVLYPPAYWNGRVVFGSCDGTLYCADAANGRILGRTELAPERRFVNIMDRLMSAWPLGGGVVLSDEGVAYTAAGSTAADGTVAASVDLATGKLRWLEAYTPDRTDPKLSFGVQGNLLLKESRLFINGGAPVGIVSLDAQTGLKSNVASRLEAGMEIFLEPDGRPFASGPELFSEKWTRTSIFKRHVGRAYFEAPGRTIALVDGRLFCASDQQALDGVINKVNQDTKTIGSPPDVMLAGMSDSILWAGKTADVRGLAVGTNGLVALHQDSVQGVSLDGQSMWTVALPAPPVRWGVALSGRYCIITLTDGQVVCLGPR